MNINAIPNNMEKHMAFMFGNSLVFLDSFQFMSSGLDKLVSNLPRKSLKYTSQKFKGKKLDLMARKGEYPYDYMDSFDKFNKKLPPKEAFYSILNDEHISDEDYNFFYYYYYHIAYVKRYSSLHTVQILTILMTQIFSITYRAPKDITYNTAIYIPYSNTYLNKRISIK